MLADLISAVFFILAPVKFGEMVKVIWRVAELPGARLGIRVFSVATPPLAVQLAWLSTSP